MLFLYILDPQYPGEGISVKKLTNFLIYWRLEVWVASPRQINAPVLYIGPPTGSPELPPYYHT